MLDNLYALMLAIGLLLLATQLLVKHKQVVHLLFAVFCGSMAMVAAQQLGSGQLGDLTYIVAFGTCATCNGYWLVARALFRGKQGVLPRHIVVAVLLGALMFASQGLGWLSDAVPEYGLLQNAQFALRELITLTSSTILMLTLWEGCRGLLRSQGQQRQQQLLFLLSYGGAVMACTLVVRFIAGSSSGDIKQWLVPVCASQIMLTTQCLIYWRYPRLKKTGDSQQQQATPQHTPVLSDDNHARRALGQQIVELVSEQQLFLQPNLKVAHVARELDVPEYRIGQAMREQLQCKNFNQYINMLRIRYACTLLKDPDARHWSVLVIGLESGFASVGPFTRAFKAEYDITPGQFRQRYFCEGDSTVMPFN